MLTDRFRSTRPSNFGKNTGPRIIDSLIVAGALNVPTELSTYVHGVDGLPHVFAPGSRIQVALGGDDARSEDPEVWYDISDGTSDGETEFSPLAPDKG